MVPSLPEASVQERFHDFTNEVEHLGKRLGRGSTRGDREPSNGLGFFRPMLFAIVLIVVVAATGLIFQVTSHPGDFVHDLGSFLVSNLFYLFLATLLFGYMIMLTPQNPRGLELLRPLANATAVAFSLWLAFGVFDILGRVYEIDAIGSLSDLVRIILPIIFILLLVIGYALVLSRDLERRAKQKSPNSVAPRRDLYRSGRERLLGGICGGIADYVDADPRVVRVFFILFAVITLGVFVLLYIILWIFLPRNPMDRWS